MTYESHITIEPVFGERFTAFESITAEYKFKPAELLMMKLREATALRSNKDSFCTGHGVEMNEITNRTVHLVSALRSAGFDVWRYKIEQILVDVKTPPLVKIV